MPKITLPTLHSGQIKLFEFFKRRRFVRARCGRRYGKTVMGEILSEDGSLKKYRIGWFTPKYKHLAESFHNIAETLGQAISHKNKTEGVIRLRSEGRVDFWSLMDEEAGRGREYDLVIIDEGAFAKKFMLDTWRKAIRPTLLKTRGKGLVLSTPNGIDEENFFYALNDPKHGFHDFHAPTSLNPHILPEEIEEERRKNDPLVFRQEFLAEFIDWSGVQFFFLEKLLINGKAPPWPDRCDAVFAVIDTAIKTGKQNDGTAVTFFAYSKFDKDHPLKILDWDICQIQGSHLVTWLPTIYERLEFLAGMCSARSGSLGAFIEDKGSGSILLQQAKSHGWKAHGISNALTALGKDERAISVSGYVYCGKVKITAPAFDKVSEYKGQTRNHQIMQVTTFKIGEEERDRQDDLLDTFCYGISVSLGNKGGF